MDKRTIEVSLETAREWYKSGNKALKEVALQVFSEEELTHKLFQDIKTFWNALEYLESRDMCKDLIHEYRECVPDSYSKKLCIYRIIVAALTNNEERKLTTGKCYFPVVQFCEVGKEKNCFGNTKVGTIEYESKRYNVIGGRADYGSLGGVGCFLSNDSVAYSHSNVGFRSVDSREIAEYISKQFGKLLFEVQYGGINCNWKWVD